MGSALDTESGENSSDYEELDQTGNGQLDDDTDLRDGNGRLDSESTETNLISSSSTNNDSTSSSETHSIGMAPPDTSATPGTKLNATKFNQIYDRFVKMTIQPIKVEQLTPDNWMDFSYSVRSKLRLLGIWDVVMIEPESAVAEKLEYKTVNDTCVDLIMPNIYLSLRKELYSVDSCHTLWKKLQDRFEGDTNTKCMRIFGTLVELIQSWSNDLAVCLPKFNQFVHDLERLFPNLDTKPFIGLLFALLPNKYRYLPSTFRSQPNLTLENVIESINAEVQLWADRDHGGAAGKHPLPSVPNCQLGSSESGGEPKKSKQSDKSKQITCSFCGKKNHTAKKCYTRLNQLKSAKESGKGQDQPNGGASKNQIPSSNLTTYGFSIVAVHQSTAVAERESGRLAPGDVIFDTGCGRQMVNNLDNCESLQSATDVFVRDAHGQSKQAGGVGKFKFISDHDGSAIELNDTIYDPSLESSYMSGGTLLRLGYSWYAEGETLWIYNKQKEVILTGTLTEDNLIKINFRRSEQTVCASLSAKGRAEVAKWHDNIGHINFHKMNKFSKTYNLHLPDCSPYRCQFCMLAKIHMKPFPRSTSRSTDILQLIHTDVSGIIRIANDWGAQYFVSFLDDYSKMGFVYLMKRKSQVYEKFLQFKNWVEKQTGKKILRVRSDQGGEYTSAEFLALEQNEGITLQNSIPRRQQQNGAAEKFGKDLVAMARTLLIAADLSPRFWPFAVVCGGVLRNKVNCSSIGDDVPYRRFWGKLPEIDNLKKFGKEVVIRKDNPEHKFGNRGDRGIFLGYARNVKGYLVYRYDDKHVVQTRDDECCDSDELVLNKEPRPADHTWKAELEYNELPEVDEIDFTDELTSTSPTTESDDLPLESSRTQINLNEFTERESDELILGVFDERTDQPNESESPSDDDDHSGDQQLSTSPTDDIRPVEKIILNRTEEAEFRQKNPNRKLEFRRPVNGKGKGKRREFVVYSIKTPKSFKQATSSDEAAHWNEAMLRELHSLRTNETWTVVDRKPSMKIVPGIWLYKVKYNADLTVDKYKARYVALGNHLEDIEKEEKFCPVLRASSFNLILSLAAQHGLDVHHVDIRTAFLYGKLDEEIFISQPPGFVDPLKPNGVCRLNRAIYGLPQSGKKFNDFITDLMKKFGLTQLMSDQCVFFRGIELIVGIYVDDLICLGKSELIAEFKTWLAKRCEITDKGPISHCLSMNVSRKDGAIFVNQETYIRELLAKFGFENVKPVSTPMVLDLKLDGDGGAPCDRTWFLGVLCFLLFLADKTRADLCFSVTRLCRYMHDPRAVHAEALKRIVRYLAGTIDLSLKFTRGEAKIECYADADFGNDLVNGKSVSGTLVYLYGNLIHWQSKRQHFVAQSTCESEILAVREGVAMTLYIRNFLHELGLLSSMTSIPTIFNDNQSAIATLIDGGCFQRNKHYQLRIYFVRDHIRKHDVRVIFKQGAYMWADCLTKPLAFTLFNRLTTDLGLVKLSD